MIGFPSFSTTKKRLKDGKGLEALPSASNRLRRRLDHPWWGCLPSGLSKHSDRWNIHHFFHRKIHLHFRSMYIPLLGWLIPEWRTNLCHLWTITGVVLGNEASGLSEYHEGSVIPRLHPSFPTSRKTNPWLPLLPKSNSHSLIKRNFHPPPSNIPLIYPPRLLSHPPPTMTWNPSFFRKPGHPLEITFQVIQAVTFFGMVFCDPKSWPESWPNSTFGDVQRSRILTFC